MGELAAAFGPALAFMLFPLLIPVVGVAVGAVTDALGRRRLERDRADLRSRMSAARRQEA